MGRVHQKCQVVWDRIEMAAEKETTRVAFEVFPSVTIETEFFNRNSAAISFPAHPNGPVLIVAFIYLFIYF